MQKRKYLVLLLTFAILLSLCACSAQGAKSGLDGAEGFYGVNDSAEAMPEKQANGTGLSSEQMVQDRKIIEYVNFTVETKAFDKLLEDIQTAVTQSGGYIESSDIGGNSYYASGNRTARLTVRIPKTKQGDFSDFLSENSNVINRSVNTEDVTDRYIDTESRIKALTLEKETLEKLISQAENVSDTLSVYERLTDVIAEIESYQGRLNQMDNKIEYTTFTLSVEEVERETVVEEENWFAKTWHDFTDNLSDVGQGLLNFLSFLLSALPYWILLAVIALAVILILRRIRKKRKSKKKAE